MKSFKLLVITPYPPFAPGGDGATTRVYHQLKILSRFAELYLIVYVRKKFEKDLDKINKFKKFCSEFKVITEGGFAKSAKKSHDYKNKIWRIPRSISMFDSAKIEIQKILDQWLIQYSLDAIQIEHSFLGTLLKNVDENIIKVVVFHDIITDIAKHKFQDAKGMRGKINYGIKHWHIKRLEKKVLSLAGAAVAMSKVDEKILLKLDDKITTIISPNGVDLKKFQPSDDINVSKTNILFMGTFTYYPMREAMMYCTNTLLPQLKKLLGEGMFKITFVGPVNDKDRETYKDKHIVFTGRTDKVDEYINNSTICINPIHYGGGTCLKILEYSASRKATIATPKGAEGLEMSNGENIVIADRNHFAEEIVNLLKYPDTKVGIASEAFNYVSQKYSWGKTTEPLLVFYMPDLKINNR